MGWVGCRGDPASRARLNPVGLWPPLFPVPLTLQSPGTHDSQVLRPRPPCEASPPSRVQAHLAEGSSG